MSDKTWERHSNPLSGWSRALSFPLLFVALWYRNWWALGLLIIFLIINPKLFPKPKHHNAWISRAVLGERLYTKQGLFKKDLATFLNYLNGLAVIAAIYYTWTHQLELAIGAILISILLKLWFLDKMVYYYEEHKK